MKVPLSAIIFSAMILGLLIPGGSLLKDAIFPLAMAIIYLNALELEFGVRRFLRREILFWAAINVLVLPAVAYLAGSFLPGNLLLGVVMAALAPTAINSLLFIGLVDGNREMGISLTAIANISSVLYIPAMVFLMFGLRLSIPYGQLLTNMVGIIVVPMVFAFATRKLMKPGRRALASLSKNMVPVLLFAIVWIIFSSAAGEILASLGSVLSVVPVMFLLAALGFGLGYLSGREKRLKRTLAISCGYKNESLIIMLAYSISPLAIIPSTVYMVAHYTFNTLVVWLFEKKKI